MGGCPPADGRRRRRVDEAMSGGGEEGKNRHIHANALVMVCYPEAIDLKQGTGWG